MTDTESQKHNVLIVDDSRDSVEAMVRLLEMLGHTAIGVESGTAALAQAGERQPDFVILDLGLPDMDGLDVATKLRQMPGSTDTTIVALSGRHTNTEQLRNCGFDYHMTKPADFQALKALLEGDNNAVSATGYRR